MSSMARGASALQSANLFHGDIQPRNVMMGDHGEVKLMEKPLIMQYYTGFNRMLFDQDYQAALTPQQLVALRNSRLSMQDPMLASNIQPDQSVQTYGESEEVFGIGMTMLAASNNHPISRYYDYTNFVVKRDLVEFDLELMEKKGLDHQYIETVRRMIEDNAALRPSLHQVEAAGSGGHVTAFQRQPMPAPALLPGNAPKKPVHKEIVHQTPQH